MGELPGSTLGSCAFPESHHGVPGRLPGQRRQASGGFRERQLRLPLPAPGCTPLPAEAPGRGGRPYGVTRTHRVVVTEHPPCVAVEGCPGHSVKQEERRNCGRRDPVRAAGRPSGEGVVARLLWPAEPPTAPQPKPLLTLPLGEVLQLPTIRSGGNWGRAWMQGQEGRTEAGTQGGGGVSHRRPSAPTQGPRPSTSVMKLACPGEVAASAS